ncbi:hypothetical protein BDV30DRAFT_215220 [Aspergillus minisclerotigenes]|uniref:Uncharacterized protein n=1 Tax=Aspergillus minisclerotigenes TaxID=656917 RepID=A0A5N6IUY5_9EURO|nr:hypothetical protein BDV30DRAFT_215220 [Aspergillus minisclerotigenes]
MGELDKMQRFAEMTSCLGFPPKDSVTEARNVQITGTKMVGACMIVFHLRLIMPSAELMYYRKLERLCFHPWPVA